MENYMNMIVSPNMDADTLGEKICDVFKNIKEECLNVITITNRGGADDDEVIDVIRQLLLKAQETNCRISVHYGSNSISILDDSDD